MASRVVGSHVVCIPLATELWQEHKLEKKFYMARQVYNRVLDEYKKRRRKYFAHPDFRRALELPEGKERKDAFISAMNATGFKEDIYAGCISTQLKDELFKGSDMEKHLGAELLRKIGARAVETIFKMHRAKTRAKKVRFKSGLNFSKDIHSINGNNSLKFDTDTMTLTVSGVRGGVKPLVLKADKKKITENILQSISGHKATSQVELVRKKVKGKVRYFAHLTCSGDAPLGKAVEPASGVVGVDIGVSYIAAYSDKGAMFFPICDPEKMSESWLERKAIDRQLDHKRRVNNPDCFDEKGRAIRGKRITRTNRHQALRDARDEMERAGAEERKRQHYENINKLLALGNVFIVEDNIYKGWQAGLFGKQIQNFAPAEFVTRLEGKAKSAGGAVHKVSTWKTYLSSRCHCGKREKKSLSDRVHKCECGTVAQRDLYSAYLARYIDPETLELDELSAKEDWGRAKALLDNAFKSV